MDDSDFDTLVTLYLRHRDPQLAGLIQTGINEQGEPIKCRVDGILHIPGDPPRCVAVAHTVSEQKEMNRKWLGGKKGKTYEPGDIKKADEEFEDWRKQTPRPQFTLYLSTNQLLKSDTKLYENAINRGKSFSIDVQIIEASQLVHFLDHTAEGQYLREAFLGIDAGRISESLLRKIAKQSLSKHWRRFGLTGAEQKNEITRDAQARVESVLANYNAPLVGVRGASGTGKSTLLRQVGQRINDSGGVCLWVPASELAADISLNALLLNTLRGFYPSLNEHAGDEALNIAADIPGGVILLIDDINRLPSPREALEAVRVWAGEAKSAAALRSVGESAPLLRFVVPLWPEQLSTTNASRRDESNWRIIELDFYSADERATLAGTLMGGEASNLLTLIDQLNGDPFLCGLALSSDLTDKHSVDADRSDLVRELFEGLLQQTAREAVETRRLVATQNDFINAVDKLIELQVSSDNPEPSWSHVREQLGDRAADLLVVISEGNRIGWIEMREGREAWRWKHDRLRDALVGRWLANNALPRMLSGEDNEELRALLKAAGLAEAWAMALIFTAPSARVRALDLFKPYQSLALVEVLQLNPFPLDEAFRGRLLNGLREALGDYNENEARFVSDPHWFLLQQLALTDDPGILILTEHVRRTWHVKAARFRNGDIDAGLTLLKEEDVFGDFTPAIEFRQLEQTVEAFARFHSSRRRQLADEMEEAAAGGDPQQAATLLVLIGYLAWAELATLAVRIWSKLNDGDQVLTLVHFVWALNRCADEGTKGQLEAALLRMRELDDGEADGEEEEEASAGHVRSRYWRFSEPLWMARRWEITPAAAEAWAKVATENPDLLKTTIYLLRGMDQPATAEAYVRLTAKMGGTFEDHIFAQQYHEKSRFNGDVHTNEATREKLWRMFISEKDEATREVAFWLWRRAASVKDLGLLREVKSDDELYEEVLRTRLLIRDRTAAGPLIERMRAKPGAWCHFAYTLYNEQGVADTLFENLEAALADDRINSQYVERLPRFLPPEGVRRLVAEKHELLMRSPRTWNALWRSGVPEAFEFLRQAVRRSSHDDLRHFFTITSYPVTQQMLKAVEPVLNYFSERQKKNLARLAANSGFARWAEEHSLGVSSESEGRKEEVRYWLSKEKAIETLNEAAGKVADGVREVRRINRFYRLEDNERTSFDVTAVLREWLGATPNGNQITVAAMLLSRIGKGTDSDWWLQFEPEQADTAHEAWSNALYILRRRRWQSPSASHVDE